MNYELHIDLLRCEHCGQHNKLLNFCSACGRQRKTIIVAQPYDYQKDMQLDFRCRGCHSQRITTPFCIYCSRAMKLQAATYPGSELKPMPQTRKQRHKKDPVKRVALVSGRYARTLFGNRACFVCETLSQPTIHHFVPTSKGGTNAPDNRLTTCRPCHDKIHAKPKKNRRKWHLDAVERSELEAAMELLAAQFEGQ